jgi:hypothetical protein
MARLAWTFCSVMASRALDALVEAAAGQWERNSSRE